MRERSRAKTVSCAVKYCHWLVSDDQVTHRNAVTVITSPPVTMSDAAERDR
jgi:site-specific recombinase XerC